MKISLLKLLKNDFMDCTVNVQYIPEQKHLTETRYGKNLVKSDVKAIN